MSDRQQYPSDQAKIELELIVAQETSGLVGAIPEQSDADLAQLFVDIINSDVRYVHGFLPKIRDFIQEMS